MIEKILVILFFPIALYGGSFNIKPFIEIGYENDLNYILSTVATYELETEIDHVTIGGDIGFYQFAPEWDDVKYKNTVKRARVFMNYHVGFGNFYVGTNLMDKGSWAVGGVMF